MKTRLVAVLVIAVLSVSILLTVVAAVGQVLSEDSNVYAAGGQTESDQPAKDKSLIGALKLVCPFH